MKYFSFYFKTFEMQLKFRKYLSILINILHKYLDNVYIFRFKLNYLKELYYFINEF